MKQNEINTKFIIGFDTVNNGGGSMVDNIYLEGGGLLSLNDECVVYYASVEDAASDKGDQAKGAFYLPKESWGSTKARDGFSYITDFGTWHTGGGVFLDWVSLDNGWFIGVNDECAVLYRSEDQFYGEEEKDYEAIIHFPLEERTQHTEAKVWSNSEINDLAEEALNIAVAHIQAKVGQSDGGLASHYFSGNLITEILGDYIKHEIMYGGNK